MKVFKARYPAVSVKDSYFQSVKEVELFCFVNRVRSQIVWLTAKMQY